MSADSTGPEWPLAELTMVQLQRAAAVTWAQETLGEDRLTEDVLEAAAFVVDGTRVATAVVPDETEPPRPYAVCGAIRELMSSYPCVLRADHRIMRPRGQHVDRDGDSWDLQSSEG